MSFGAVIRKSQPALFWCMRSLPKSKREAVFTLFAFCRHLDSVVRSSMPESEKLDLLNAWREELDNIYERKVPLTNIGRKIYKNCMRFNLQKKLWLEILNSAFLKMNAGADMPDLQSFKQYIYGSSEVPLLLFLMIIDNEHIKAKEELAKNLGQALSLTYMLRDVKDDAGFGYLYFPKEFLQQAEVKQTQQRKIVEDRNFISVREKLAQHADNCYAKAERLLSKMNYADTRALRMLHNLGRCQFEMMKERGWEIISPKPKVNAFKRFNIFYHTVFG